MKISPVSMQQNYARPKQPSFKGYGGTAIKGVCLDTYGAESLADELSKIGDKEGFEVIPTGKKATTGSFVQDRLMFFPGKKLPLTGIAEGGNWFITKKDGKNCLLMGKNDRAYVGTILKNTDIDEVVFLPQMDWHLDLTMIPLPDNVVLIVDDNEMLKVIESGKKELPHLKEQLGLLSEALKESIRKNNNAITYELEDALESRGFTPVRVPGRIYGTQRPDPELDCALEIDTNSAHLAYALNYMNAITHKRPDGSIVCMTNKDRLNIHPEIRVLFENAFRKATAPYIKDLYFLDGDGYIAKRLGNGGGIHCIAAEIPE
jgi:hypothetical protein